MRRFFIFWTIMLGFALALPSQEPPRTPRSSCIHMTPEKEQQIDSIVEKLSDFLNSLQMEHEHFDIRLIKLAIEQHTPDEIEEKETMLQLSVNDCQLNDDELDEIDHHREKARQRELEKLKGAGSDGEAKKNFDVMYLDLPENGQRLIEAVDKARGKGPRLIYVAKDQGQLDYMFLARK